MSSLTIAAASSIAQAPISSQIDIAVAKKSLDAQKQQGDAAIQLLEAAAETQQAQNAAPTHGGSLDVTA